MWRVYLVLLVACGAPRPSSRPVAPSPVEPFPLKPILVVDEPATGAVPIPGEDPEPPRPLNIVDTTVTLAELPPINGTWLRRGRVDHAGHVLVALNHTRGHLAMTFVTTDEDAAGYPGALDSYLLVELAEGQTPEGGSTFPGLPRDARGARGPIHAAVRVLPHAGASEAARQRVVLYTPPNTKTLLVATQLVGAAAWTPLLRVDTRADSIELVSPGWH